MWKGERARFPLFCLVYNMSPKPAAHRYIHLRFQEGFPSQAGRQVSHEVCSAALLLGESDEVFLDCVRSSGMTPFNIKTPCHIMLPERAALCDRPVE